MWHVPLTTKQNVESRQQIELCSENQSSLLLCRWVARHERAQLNPASLQRLWPLQHLRELYLRLSETWSDTIDDGKRHSAGAGECRLPEPWRAAISELQVFAPGCSAECTGCPHVDWSCWEAGQD